jgi:hypothetical protein
MDFASLYPSYALAADVKASRDRDSRVQHDWEIVEEIYSAMIDVKSKASPDAR